MSDNQWIRLSGKGQGLNLAQAKKITPLDDTTVAVTWAPTGEWEKFHGEKAKRILAWLVEQYLPPIAP